MRVALLEAGKLQQIEQLRHAGFPVGLLPFLDFQAERDVLEDRHVLEQGVILKDETDVPLLDRESVDGFAVDDDLPGGGHFQAGNHPQHRGLAAAARPEQSHQLAFANGEGDIVNGRDVAELLRDFLDDNAHWALLARRMVSDSVGWTDAFC